VAALLDSALFRSWAGQELAQLAGFIGGRLLKQPELSAGLGKF